MENLIVREAAPQDAEKLLAYVAQIGAETDNLSFGAEGFPFTIEQEAEYLADTAADPHAVHYLAWCGNELVGDANLSSMPRRMSHRAELGIAVVKAAWGQGVGTALLQKIVDYAKGHGIEMINLEVRSDNLRAIALYEKFGFVKTGVSPAFFKIGDSYIDFTLMALDLRETKEYQ